MVSTAISGRSSSVRSALERGDELRRQHRAGALLHELVDEAEDLVGPPAAATAARSAAIVAAVPAIAGCGTRGHAKWPGPPR